MAGAALRDLRFAVRTLLRAPAFTAAVVTTMALGIGTTVSMFTVVNSIVLRPLPFAESERVVMLCETSPRMGDWCGASPSNVADWASTSRMLDSAGVARNESFIARSEQGSSALSGAIATPGFFHVLRLRPALGRLFEEGDLNPGSNTVVVVSHAYWRSSLEADPAAIGRTIALDGRAFRVIGVLPADAYIPQINPPDVWKPLTASIDDVRNRNWRGFAAIGRIAGDAPRTALEAELKMIAGRLAEAYPEANAGWGIRVVDLRERTVGSTGATLWMFLGATALVLLIACANVAGLMLVRATRRAPEFAVRTSLGAGRGCLARQLLTESLVISLAGGALGLLFASWATRGFVLAAPPSIPRLAEVTIDGRVAAFALLVSAATALLFGLAPARQASKLDLTTTLNGRRHGAPRETRLRSALVIVEIALALVLLVGAGLLMRSFGRLVEWDPGFPSEGLMTSWMLAPTSARQGAGSAVGLLERARDTVAALPGMQAAGLASGGPLFGGIESDTLSIDGEPPLDPAAATVNWFDISPEYFATLGTPIVKGRALTAADSSGAPNVAVVNQTFARRFFRDADPIGRRVTVMEHTSDIVGIVADVRPYRPDRATPPEIYWPIRQYPRLGAYLVMRVGPEAGRLDAMVRARVASVDPDLQLTPLVSLDERFSRALVTPRFNMLLLGAFALVATALAAVGVFGMIAYSVASRTREIGVRIALGAPPQRLVADIVRRGLTLAAAGMALGLAGALATGRLLASLLYGLPATDWLTLATTVAGFAIVAFGASYLPARRAARIDPLVALRQE